MTSVDLPEPDTPVTATNRPSGMSTVRFRRLLARAPDDPEPVLGIGAPGARRAPAPGARPGDTAPVSEVGCWQDRPRRSPSATTSPPKRPARGPRSITWSAARDRLLVVLHHDHRVAQVAQPAQRAEQALVVPLVQADARLVEDVEHADQARADLGGQPDALGLAAGERRRAAAQREVVEPDVPQEAQPVAHFLEDRAGDLGVEPRALARCSGAGSARRTRAPVRPACPPRRRCSCPSTSTARLSGLSRLPPQVWQGCSIMNSSS